MDTVMGISARLAEIRAGLQGLAAAPPVQRAAPVAPARSAAAFQASLDSAVAATATTPSRRTADGVPADLARYGNGRVPASALESIGGTSHRLWAPAAQAFDRLHGAAARDGVKVGITDSYRSYDAQVDVAARKGLYSQGGLAAEPGTSPHGWGLAVDLRLDPRAQAWMRANAGAYGFVENTPREPWHWVYER